MSTYQWLLMLHVTGAFLLFGGSVMAATLNVLALRAKRPSDVAMFLSLVRIAVIPIMVGAFVALVLGLWLVHHVGYSYGAFWVWGSIILWVAANGLGRAGGQRQEQTARLASRLAGEGDEYTEELRASLRDPVANALSWSSGLAVLLILVFMIWKPGQ